MAPINTWTLVGECPIPNDITPLMVGDERPVAAYKTFRDTAIFTTKRLIVRDSQGITGRKVEMYSLPCSSINMWSSENAGTLDLSHGTSLAKTQGSGRVVSSPRRRDSPATERVEAHSQPLQNRICARLGQIA